MCLPLRSGGGGCARGTGAPLLAAKVVPSAPVTFTTFAAAAHSALALAAAALAVVSVFPGARENEVRRN